MSKCTKVEQSLDDQRINEWSEYHAQRQGFDKKFGYNTMLGVIGKINTSVDKIVKSNKPLTKKQLDKAINQYVKPGEKEQKRLALEIVSRMQANPKIQPMMYHIINKHVENFNRDNPQSNMQWETNDFDERVPIIDTIPVPALRNIFRELNGALNIGRMFRNDRGLLGTMQYEWGSPRQMMLKDPSGTMFAVNQVTELFTYNAQSYANLYLYEPRTKQGRKFRDFGFVSIISDVIDFEAHDMQLPEGVGWQLFSEIMEGRTVYDPNNGFIFRHQEEVKMPDGHWEWKKPTAFTYGQNQENTIQKFTPEQLKRIQEIEKQARYMFQLIGEEITKEVESTKLAETNLRERAKQNGQLEWLESKIVNLIDDSIEIAGLNAVEMKSGKYYPRMFWQGIVATEMQESMEKQQKALKQKRQLLNNPNKELTTLERSDLTSAIIDHQASIIYLQEQLQMRFDPESSIDPMTGEGAMTKDWYKNFKNITRIMNPDRMRYDQDVMLDYVSQVSNTVIRNNSIIKIGNALLDAKIDGQNDNVIDASWDLFNTTFYPQNAASQMFGIDMRTSNLSNTLSKANINVSPERLTQLLNRISNMTTLNTLYGPLQGITNASAMMLKLDRFGKELFLESAYQMTDPKFRNKWRDRIKASGINSFTEFVDTYFTTSLRPEEVNAYKAEIKHFVGLVKQAEKTGNTIKIRQYKDYIKKIKRKNSAVGNTFAKAAQFVITRSNSYKQNASKYGKAFGVVGNFLKVFPSIDETEQSLRSQSFIIGSMVAVKSGRAKNYDSKEAIDAGIQMAMSLDFGLSHQHVGAALRGPLAGSTINKMKIWHNQKAGWDWRQFRNAVRSMTPDMELDNGQLNIKAMNAFRLGKSTVKLLATTPLTGAIGAGVATGVAGLSLPFLAPLTSAYVAGGASGLALLSRRARKTRELNNYVASFDSMFLRQALVTGLMDLVLFAPGSTMLTNRALKSGFLASPLSKGVMGMSSGMMSLALASGQIASSLLRGDEEEEIKALLPKMIMSSPLGLGAGAIFSAAMWGLDTIYDPQKYNYNNLRWHEDNKKRAITPYFPFGNTGYDLFKLAKDAVAQK